MRLVLLKSIGEKIKQAAPPRDTLNLLGEVFSVLLYKGEYLSRLIFD